MIAKRHVFLLKSSCRLYEQCTCVLESVPSQCVNQLHIEWDPLVTLIRLGHCREELQLASRCGAAVKVGHGGFKCSLRRVAPSEIPWILHLIRLRDVRTIPASCSFSTFRQTIQSQIKSSAQLQRVFFFNTEKAQMMRKPFFFFSLFLEITALWVIPVCACWSHPTPLDIDSPLPPCLFTISIQYILLFISLETVWHPARENGLTL